MRLAGFAACVGAYAKTPKGAGFVAVKMDVRHSDICLVRAGVELARERIPIGRSHFVNDVAVCLDIGRKDAEEMMSVHGLLSSPGEPYAEVVEARAAEFAGFIRDTLHRAGVGDVPVMVAGDGGRIAGLASMVQ